jgi:hypothetical protein
MAGVDARDDKVHDEGQGGGDGGDVADVETGNSGGSSGRGSNIDERGDKCSVDSEVESSEVEYEGGGDTG